MLPGKQATCKRCQAGRQSAKQLHFPTDNTHQNKQTNTPATTDNEQQATSNKQRATCNTQLQPSAAINGRQSNGEAARIKSTGASTESAKSVRQWGPSLFLTFPSNVANRFWVIFQNCICMLIPNEKLPLLPLLAASCR